MKKPQKCYLDSNILIYYTNKDSAFHQNVKSCLEKLVAEDVDIFISSLAIDEFLYALIQMHKVIKKKLAADDLKKILENILQIPNLKITNPSVNKEINLRVIEFMKKYDLKPRDAYHYIIMDEQNIEYFFTYDEDFKKVFNDGALKAINKSS